MSELIINWAKLSRELIREIVNEEINKRIVPHVDGMPSPRDTTDINESKDEIDYSDTNWLDDMNKTIEQLKQDLNVEHAERMQAISDADLLVARIQKMQDELNILKRALQIMARQTTHGEIVVASIICQARAEIEAEKGIPEEITK